MALNHPLVSLMWSMQLVGISLLTWSFFADMRTAAYVGFALMCVSIGISISILFWGVGLIGSPSPSGES